MNNKRSFIQFLIAIAPFVLLFLAALMYYRDISRARQRSEAAVLVRQAAFTPATDTLIMYRLEDRAMPFMVRCPPMVASNLLAALSHAEAVKFPRGTVEGEEFEIRLIQTNAPPVLLRAVVLEKNPEDLYVGLKTELGKAAEDAPAKWKISPPARIRGAGALFGVVLDGIRKTSGKLPPEEELRQAILSNAARRVSTPTNILPGVVAEEGAAEE